MSCCNCMSGPNWPLNLLSVFFCDIVLNIKAIGVMILLPVAFAFQEMSVLWKIVISFTIPPHILHTLPQSPPLPCVFLPFMTLLPCHHHPLLLFSFPSLQLITWHNLRILFPNHLSHTPTLIALALSSWPVLRNMLMIVLILMSLILNLISYRCTKDTIYVIVLLWHAGSWDIVPLHIYHMQMDLQS
jgi:hypothetical protein